MKNILIEQLVSHTRLQEKQTSNSPGQLSHAINPISEKEAVDKARARVEIKWKNLPQAKYNAYQKLFEEAIKIPVVRYMIVNKGLNGYWTDYILNHPITPKPVVNDLERRILEEFPLIKATQERDQIFQNVNQRSVKNGACLATIPCGLSREVLNLNYENITVIKLHSIDIDQESLILSQSKANDKLSKYNKNGNPSIEFTTELCDAWDLKHKESFDLVSSNGLIIYEQNDQKVLQLFIKFYEALKPGGMLTTSFMALPDEWNMTKIDKDTLETQKIIFKDIIEAQFQALRSTNHVITSLKQCGFKQIEIITDSASIFPTVIAYR